MKGRLMNKSILIFLALSMLLAGNSPVILAAESTTQNQPATSSTVLVDAPKLDFATPLQWKSTGVLIKAHLCDRLLQFGQNLEYGIPEL